MTDDQHPTPGHDEIMVAAATGQTMCRARGHARLGVQAEVVVTLGDLGTHWQPGALWQDCWGPGPPPRPGHHRRHRRPGRVTSTRGP